MNRIYPNSEQKDLSTVIVYNVSVEPGGPLFYDKEGTKPADADYIFELAIRNLLVIARTGIGSDIIYYFPVFITDGRVDSGVLEISSFLGKGTRITFTCTKSASSGVTPTEPDDQTPGDDAISG